MENVYWLVTVVAIAYWLSFRGFCAWLAEEKGRNFFGWFGLGFVFGFIALLALVGAPVLDEVDE